MNYEYKALFKGQTIVGQIEAETVKEVTDYLKSNDYFPVEVKERQSSAVSSVLGLFERISFNDITYMTKQFSIMLNAGLTLINSIEILKKQYAKKSMKEMLSSFDKSLREGKNFSQALAKYPQYFSNFYIALVRSGEASGKLDLILEKLSTNLESQREFRQKVRNAMIYPVVILSAMIVMMFVMMTFVVPKLLDLYKNFDVELTTSTKILMYTSKFLEKYWVFIIVIAIGLIFIVRRALKTTSGKIFYDGFVMRLPVFGKIIKTSALVDASRTLSILIGAGVPILDSLSIVTDVNENTLFKNAFKRVNAKVEKGLSIGTSMSNEPIFPESLIQMTIVGEQTGHLDETLGKVSQYYQSESEMAVKAMLTLIEPAILIILGIAVGFLVMTVITPIFNLTSSLQ